MRTLGSPSSVVAAIREEADADVERIEQTTADELASIRAAAASASVAIADRDARLTAARRANEERIARQEWEGHRATIEQRETWIQRVVAKAHQTWTGGEPAKRREQLNALIRDARSRLPAGACVLSVSAGDRELVDAGDARVITATIAGGCIVTIGDTSFDNSFEARSRRLEPEWRNALSGMYKP
ncbi:MAG TPA: V-type ATP synthase subunit E family protein [Thermoanaerobaculia bacterium]